MRANLALVLVKDALNSRVGVESNTESEEESLAPEEELAPLAPELSNSLFNGELGPLALDASELLAPLALDASELLDAGVLSSAVPLAELSLELALELSDAELEELLAPVADEDSELSAPAGALPSGEHINRFASASA
eukprot:g1085.t1